MNTQVGKQVKWAVVETIDGEIIHMNSGTYNPGTQAAKPKQRRRKSTVAPVVNIRKVIVPIEKCYSIGYYMCSSGERQVAIYQGKCLWVSRDGKWAHHDDGGFHFNKDKLRITQRIQ